MDSVRLDMDDIFDDRNDAEAEEDFAMPPPMPDLDVDEGAMAGASQDGGDGDDDEVQKKLRDMSKGAGKKRVMRPQPKLDATRLKSERGLPILPKLFTEVKFRGKGHEAEDLNRLMGKLEHWGHRLFPKMPFDEFTARLEKLGSKKEVQNCVKRIRLDMPILDEDFVLQQAEENQEEANTSVAPPDEVNDMDAEEAYEEMIRQEREQLEQLKIQKNNDEDGVPPGGKDDASHPPRMNGQAAATPETPSGNEVPSEDTKGGLTAEQKEKIERNKRLAMERRMARLGNTPKGLKQNTTPTSTTGPSSSPSDSLRSPGSSHEESSHKNDANAKEKTLPKDDMQTEEEIMSTLLAEEEQMDTEEGSKPTMDQNAQELSQESGQLRLETHTTSNSEGALDSNTQSVGREIEENMESETLKLKLSVSDGDVTQSDVADGNSTMDSVITDDMQNTNSHMSPSQDESEDLRLNLSETAEGSDGTKITMSTSQSDEDMADQVVKDQQSEHNAKSNGTDSLVLEMTLSAEGTYSHTTKTRSQVDSDKLNLKLTVADGETESIEMADSEAER